MAGYEPKRPRPAVASDLDSLIGSDDGPLASSGGVVDPGPAGIEDVSPETTEPDSPRASLDPTPPAARHALPRAAKPLDRRLPPVALAGAIVGAAVLLFLWRRRGHVQPE